MCYCEVIIEPFSTLPPDGELPTLRKHELNQIIDEVENCVKSSVQVSRKMSFVEEISPIDTQLHFDDIFDEPDNKLNRC